MWLPGTNQNHEKKYSMEKVSKPIKKLSDFFSTFQGQIH